MRPNEKPTEGDGKKKAEQSESKDSSFPIDYLGFGRSFGLGFFSIVSSFAKLFSMDGFFGIAFFIIIVFILLKLLKNLLSPKKVPRKSEKETKENQKENSDKKNE